MRDKFYTTLEAARILGVSATSIRTWCEEKKLQAERRKKDGARGFEWHIPVSEIQRKIFEQRAGEPWIENVVTEKVWQEITLAIKMTVYDAKGTDFEKAFTLASTLEIFQRRAKIQHGKDYKEISRKMIEIDEKFQDEKLEGLEIFDFRRFWIEEMEGVEEEMQYEYEKGYEGEIAK